MSRYGGYSTTRLYVGNVPIRTRRSQLEDLFAPYGSIREVDIKSNFAFVEFHEPSDADEARRFLNGVEFDGCSIVVEFARRISRGGFGQRSNGRAPSQERFLPGPGRAPSQERFPPGAGRAGSQDRFLPGAGRAGSQDRYFGGRDERCFNCGERGHWASDCQLQDRRCYRCGEPGHIGRNCPNSRYPRRSRSRSPIRRRRRNQISRRSRSPYYGRSRSPIYNGRRSPSVSPRRHDRNGAAAHRPRFRNVEDADDRSRRAVNEGRNREESETDDIDYQRRAPRRSPSPRRGVRRSRSSSSSDERHVRPRLSAAPTPTPSHSTDANPDQNNRSTTTPSPTPDPINDRHNGSASLSPAREADNTSLPTNSPAPTDKPSTSPASAPPPEPADAATAETTSPPPQKPSPGVSSSSEAYSL